MNLFDIGMVVHLSLGGPPLNSVEKISMAPLFVITDYHFCELGKQRLFFLIRPKMIAKPKVLGFLI